MSSTPAEFADDSRYFAQSLEDLEDAGAEHRRFEITTDAKFRLDKHLCNSLKGISRSQVQKLIALGGVTVNGNVAKPATKLKAGDVIEVVVPPKPSIDLRPEPIPIEVLYEDDDLIVLNKQTGIIVHPARKYLSGTLVNALAYHLQQQQQQQQQHADAERSPRSEASGSAHPKLSDVGRDDARPGVVHRLDMNTTGVILFAKQDATHWLLAKQFEERTNLKCYLALCHGCPDPPSGAIDAPIGKHPMYREAMAVRHDSHGKESLTLYRVRRRYNGYSLIECELKSGRTHQIRVHLSYLGFPIVGDTLYGGAIVGPPELAQPLITVPGGRPNMTFALSKQEGEVHERIAQQRREAGESPLLATPALHAALLRVVHPVTRERMTFTAPVHDHMGELIHWLEQHGNPRHVIDDGTHVDLDYALTH